MNRVSDRSFVPREQTNVGALIDATLLHVLAVIPVTLLGGAAVLVREDLRLSEMQLGIAASVFLGVAAVTSVPGGRIVNRLSTTAAMTLVNVINLAAILAIGLLTRGYVFLLACLAVAGLANGMVSPATAVSVIAAAPERRWGLAFGIKQACGPLGALLAGLAVPVIAVRYGWRAAFVVCGLAGVALLAARAVRRESRPGRPARAVTIHHLAAAHIIGLAAGIAAVARTGVSTFYVESAVRKGLGVADAAMLFAVGGAAAVGVHVLLGWMADRRVSSLKSLLTTIAGLMVLGSVGMGIFAVTDLGAVMVLATILTFAAGWGWPGLLHLAIARGSGAATASATGLVMAGIFAGSTIGPVVFGAIAQYGSFRLAWGMAAALLVVAGLLIALTKPGSSIPAAAAR